MNTLPRPADPAGEPALPVPAVHDLPADRLELRRGHLLNEIGGTAPAGRYGSLRRHLRLTVGLTTATAALAVAAVVVQGGASDPARNPGGLAVVKLGTASTATVARELRRISLVAAKSAVSVRPDQYAYTRSQFAYAIPTLERTMPGEGPMHMQPMVHRQIWVSQQPRNGLGRIIDNGEPMDLHQSPEPDPQQYTELAKLPTDPDALLRHFYAAKDTADREGTTEDQRVFNAIGSILEYAVIPPKLAGALYRAVAEIPGVTMVDSAQDAAGRTGVAVAREDAGTRTEWIFNRDTLEYLGQRKVQLAATKWLKPGMLLATTAIFERAIVDDIGDVS